MPGCPLSEKPELNPGHWATQPAPHHGAHCLRATLPDISLQPGTEPRALSSSSQGLHSPEEARREDTHLKARSYLQVEAFLPHQASPWTMKGGHPSPGSPFHSPKMQASLLFCSGHRRPHPRTPPQAHSLCPAGLVSLSLELSWICFDYVTLRQIKFPRIGWNLAVAIPRGRPCTCVAHERLGPGGVCVCECVCVKVGFRRVGWGLPLCDKCLGSPYCVP